MTPRYRLREIQGRPPTKAELRAAKRERRGAYWAGREAEALGDPIALLAVQHDHLRTRLSQALKAAERAVKRAKTPGQQETAQARLAATRTAVFAACERAGRVLETEIAAIRTEGRHQTGTG